MDGGTKIDIDSHALEVIRGRFDAGIRRVLLIIPPDGDAGMLDFGIAKSGRYYNAPPYGAGLLATHLRNDGIEVEILNLNDQILTACQSIRSTDFDYESIVIDRLIRSLANQPDLIGLSCLFSMTHRSLVDVLRNIRVLAPTIPVALGGVHVTNVASQPQTRDSALKDFQEADYIFLYESELSFKNFVRSVNGRDDGGLSQLMILQPEFIHVKGRLPPPTGDDLDKIPAYDLMDLRQMSSSGKIGGFHCFKDPGTVFATVLSNRGCRGSCTFCSVRNFNGISVRGRSIQSVIDELLILRHEHDVSHIMWLDDDLFYNHDRTVELFRQMVKQDVGITWDASNGIIAAACTPELLGAAEESGCLGLNIGMESGNREILRKIRKPGTVKNFLEAARLLHDVPKIHARILLMVGFPGETFGQIKDTTDVAREMDLDWAYISPLQVMPNTAIFNTVMDSNAVDTNSLGKISYNSGAYGIKKNSGAAVVGRDATRSVRAMGREFRDVFERNVWDSVPTPEDIQLIWAYMNYWICFERLGRESRPEKLDIGIRFLNYLGTQVAPDEAFVHYYKGLLEKKALGRAAQGTLERLEKIIADAPYWVDRLNDFGLSIRDLDTGY